MWPREGNLLTFLNKENTFWSSEFTEPPVFTLIETFACLYLTLDVKF